MNSKEKTILFLATAGRVGNSPFAPGTFGTLVALPLCFLLSLCNISFVAIFIITFIVLAIWVAQEAEKLIKEKDPGCIVIDEIAGMMVTLLGLPFDPITVVAGFLIFRILDIFKPFPARMLEKTIPGGAGVVLDDIAAGIWGNLILRIVLIFMA
ncbi:MAG: phosphatidylglycerophosphatase A [Deltaproteobacteria bacterium]|nr:phosphatidylglycerophosphatase A [Deltaproteobacteria bacterium]